MKSQFYTLFVQSVGLLSILSTQKKLFCKNENSHGFQNKYDNNKATKKHLPDVARHGRAPSEMAMLNCSKYYCVVYSGRIWLSLKQGTGNRGTYLLVL